MSDEVEIKAIFYYGAKILPKIEKTKEEKNKRNRAKRLRRKHK